MASRPLPPKALLEPIGAPAFVAAPEIVQWAFGTFISPDAAVRNEDHAHLEHAQIGALWASVPNSRQGRRIVGQAELGEPRAMMGKWAKARAEQQILQWFGEVPDFIITIDAAYAAACSDAEFCALIEHELYHCAPELNEFGQPKFTKLGLPKFAMRGHDVEEFIGVVRRYGADASGVREMIDAAKRAPEVASVKVSQACGTCMLRAA